MVTTRFDETREEPRDGGEAGAELPVAVRQAIRSAVGLFALPLAGLGLLLARVSDRETDHARNGSALRPETFPEPAGESPPRQEVEAALLALSDATLPRKRPRRGGRSRSGLA